MEPADPVSVLIIGTEVRFLLVVALWRCRCCGSVFAPSPFSVGCFPATPKVSWDVAQASIAHPACWLDLWLLQLCDSIIHGGGRSAAVYSLATAIHQQHTLNGRADPPLSWGHFKRLLGDVLAVRPRCLDWSWAWEACAWAALERSTRMHGCTSVCSLASCLMHTGLQLPAMPAHGPVQPWCTGHSNCPPQPLPLLCARPCARPAHQCRLLLWSVPLCTLQLSRCATAATQRSAVSGQPSCAGPGAAGQR